jgi:hypothetical protein
VAAEDAVVVAAVHPLHQLLHAPHGVGVRPLTLCEDAHQPVPTGVPLLVFARLPQEGVQVEAPRRDTRGHHHQHAAGGERVSAGEGAGTIGRELCCAVPLEQYRPDRAEGEPDDCRKRTLHPEEDREGRLVQDVVGEYVAEFVPEQRPQLVGVEHFDELRRDDDDRPSRTDRHCVRPEREVRGVEIGQLRQVEGLAGPLVDGP